MEKKNAPKKYTAPKEKVWGGHFFTTLGHFAIYI
jgi:hypothetical protein